MNIMNIMFLSLTDCALRVRSGCREPLVINGDAKEPAYKIINKSWRR